MPRIKPKTDTTQPINIYKTMAHSPVFLEAFQTFTKTLATGTLSDELREKIALTVAGINDCEYCKSAHTKLAQKAGVSDEGIRYAMTGKCGNPKIHAALTFVRALVENKGQITDADYKAVKDAGYTDGEIIEIFGQTIVNIATNYFNLMTGTQPDFGKEEYQQITMQKAG